MGHQHLSDGKPDHQIKLTPLALRRIREHLGTQPFDLAKIEAIRPVGKEQFDELGEKLLKQGLETLVVVRHDPILIND
jgi:hypothetical protein